MRVPMQGTGADYLVVAMKVGNATGAKGIDYPAIFRDQPFMGGICEESKVV